MKSFPITEDKEIIVKQGDITLEQVDAIVNPANSRLMHGGGAARAIALKGGPVIVKQSQNIIAKIGLLPVSHCVVTDGGNLLAKFVIHVVGPQMGEGKEDEKLQQAVANMLFLANLYHLKTISMPAISSGIFGFPKRRCAEILINSAQKFLSQPDVYLQQVIFCNHDDETYSHFVDVATTYLL